MSLLQTPGGSAATTPATPMTLPYSPTPGTNTYPTSPLAIPTTVPEQDTASVSYPTTGTEPDTSYPNGSTSNPSTANIYDFPRNVELPAQPGVMPTVTDI